MAENLFLDQFEQQAILNKLDYLKQICRDQADHEDIQKHLGGLECLLLAHRKPKQECLSAQISLYPLRQVSLSQTINAALDKLKSCDLSVTPGSMSTIISGQANEIWAGLYQAFSAAADQSEIVMILTISNCCPQPACGEG
jgi:uncharacterized protein YqgV (UPF0045/DUF77 family)